MIFASDLDRTLIYSSEFVRNEPPESVDIIEYYNGGPISWVSRKMVDMLRTISERATFVPVTTRSIEQYRRVELWNRVSCKYAITTNGANILIDGKPDIEWNQKMHSSIRSQCEHPEKVAERLKTFENRPWMIKVREVEQVFHYFVVDEKRFDASELQNLFADLKNWNWDVIFNGRKIYFIPNVLEKVTALKRIMELEDCRSIYSAGDTSLDICMAEISERFYLPGHGEVKGLDQHYSNIFKLEEQGIRASERICGDVLKVLDGSMD